MLFKAALTFCTGNQTKSVNNCTLLPCAWFFFTIPGYSVGRKGKINGGLKPVQTEDFGQCGDRLQKGAPLSMDAALKKKKPVSE